MSDLIVRPRMLKSGKMVYEYAFEIARIDGKRKRKTKSGFRTKREAKEAGKIELSLYEKCGQTTKDTNISVADFFDLWMEKDCGLTCKESTLDGYHKKIRLYIKPSIGEYYLKNITKDILQDFIKDMYDKGFSKNTISSIRGIVTKAFRWAEEKHYIVASPATNLIIPRNQQPQKATITRQKPHIYVSEDRIQQIFERFPEKEPAHLPLMIIYHCGLRVGEVFGLIWEDIDFENKLLRVNRQVQWHQGKRTKKDIKLYNGTSKSNGYWYFSEPKYNSYRQIDLDDELIALLKREKEWQLKSEEYYAEYYTRYYCDQKLYVLGEKPTYDIIPMNPIKTTKTDNEINFVCRRENGTFTSPRVLTHASSVIHRELDFPEYDTYSLRHTHATMLLENNVNMVYVQKRLGHKDISVTMNIYANHVTPKIKNNSNEKLNEMYKKE